MKYLPGNIRNLSDINIWKGVHIIEVIPNIISIVPVNSFFHGPTKENYLFMYLI